MAYITSIMADFIFNISTKIADLADNIRKTPKSIDWHMLCNVERAPKISIRNKEPDGAKKEIYDKIYSRPIKFFI